MPFAGNMMRQKPIVTTHNWETAARKYPCRCSAFASYGTINADTVLATGIDCLQSFGMTFKKAEYITDSALLYAAAECV